MAGNIKISPLIETTIERAVFLNEDIIVYPDRDSRFPDNFSNVIKFLFGEGAYAVQDCTNGYPSFTIKNANYELRKARTINAEWTTIVKE